MQRAAGIATTSTHHAHKLGALALRGGAPIGWGVNRFRNHPRVVEDWADCSIHAEQALAESCDIAGAVIYVARVKSSGATGIAKPCRHCLRLLTEAGARRVVWTENQDCAGMMSLS